MIALHMIAGQWCKTKVNYVGLLVGHHGTEPQSNHIQAIQTTKAPSSLSELHSFLGMCNYSRQIIENNSDIARPLTLLLKKDAAFHWTEKQEQAMSELHVRGTMPGQRIPPRSRILLPLLECRFAPDVRPRQNGWSPMPAKH